MHSRTADLPGSARLATLLFIVILTVCAGPAGGPAWAAVADGSLAGAAPAAAALPATAPAADAPAPVSVVATAPAVDVAIQAGHWQESALPDPLARLRASTGTSGGGRTEVDLNLDIAGRVARLLRARGLTVAVLPATVPTGFQADLFIALHADGNSTSAARGYKVSTRWNSAVAALDATLVQTLDSGYGAVTGLPRDSSITRAMRGYYAYSTRRSEEYRLSSSTPAAIIEMGFMTNAADRAVLFDAPDLVAEGVAAGVARFYAALPAARARQAAAEQQAAASPSHRAAVALYDAVSIRSAGNGVAARVAGAAFGAAFPVLGRAPAFHGPPPGGVFTPEGGTALASGAGWYNVALPDSSGSGYISRDVVVVQQSPFGR